jgi:hypothetical protein
MPGGLAIANSWRLLGDEVVCAEVTLRSFASFAAGLPVATQAVLTLPYTQPWSPGIVLADAVFTNAYGCHCVGTHAEHKLMLLDLRDVHCDVVVSKGLSQAAWKTLLVVVAIAPMIMVALVAYIVSRCAVHEIGA